MTKRRDKKPAPDPRRRKGYREIQLELPLQADKAPRNTDKVLLDR